MSVQTREDPYQRLEEEADRETPESWVPEQAGEQIAGELVRYERGTTAYGERIIAVLRTRQGRERSVWLLHAVLRGEFARLRPRPGERLLVRYLGRKKSDNGTEYAAYKLVVDRENRATEPDWDALGDDAPASDVPADASDLHAPIEAQDGDSSIPF